MNQASLTHSPCRRSNPSVLGCVEEPSAVNESQMGTHRFSAIAGEEGHSDLPVLLLAHTVSVLDCSSWVSPGLLERGLILHGGKMSEQVLHKISLYLLCGFVVVFLFCWDGLVFLFLFVWGFCFGFLFGWLVFFLFGGCSVCQAECPRGSGALTN